MYAHLLQKMLTGDDIGYGKNGYYLASSGAIGWHDLYTEMAKALAAQGAVDDEVVKLADDNALVKMGEALGCPKEAVRLQLGGKYDRTDVSRAGQTLTFMQVFART